MNTTENLLNDLIKHFKKEQMDASLEMSNYYESEYGDNIELDYPEGAIGDPKGFELEAIPGVYNKVVRHLIARLNKEMRNNEL